MNIDHLLNTEHLANIDNLCKLKTRIDVYELQGLVIVAGFEGEYILMAAADGRMVRLSLTDSFVISYDK
jgi:hypothetical protein